MIRSSVSGAVPEALATTIRISLERWSCAATGETPKMPAPQTSIKANNLDDSEVRIMPLPP